MKIFRSEEGQTLVLTAFCGMVLLGFLGLALDVGSAFRTRRNLQAAADAAAIAAANEAQYGQVISPCTSGVQYQCAAINAAALNGVTASHVTVNAGTSITTGYHQTAGFYEAIVSQTSPTYFMTALGFSSLTVTARAVTGATPSPACMYVLDPNNTKDALYTKHTISATNCGVQVNSSSPNATCDHGTGELVATFLHVVGGQDTGGGCKANTVHPCDHWSSSDRGSAQYLQDRTPRRLAQPVPAAIPSPAPRFRMPTNSRRRHPTLTESPATAWSASVRM